MFQQASKQKEFEDLQQRVAELERELAEAQVDDSWRARIGTYPAYAATTGFLLGGIGASVALLVNVIGATLVGRHPFELIRVYLTFPLGEQALQLNSVPRGPGAIDDRMILLLGICLYLGMGMLIGIVFQLIFSKFANKAPLGTRLFVGTLTALSVWLINFYAILIWLQPLFFGGDWIANPQYQPVWVAAGTHLVYGWTMALLSPLGEFPAVSQTTENP